MLACFAEPIIVIMLQYNNIVIQYIVFSMNLLLLLSMVMLFLSTATFVPHLSLLRHFTFSSSCIVSVIVIDFLVIVFAQQLCNCKFVLFTKLFPWIHNM